MDYPDENPVLPAAQGLSWRSLQPADVGAITALATTCLAADGGHLLAATADYVREHYVPTGRGGSSLGAFELDGRLVACAAVQPTHTPEACQMTMVGQVGPGYRRRGFGTSLLRWSTAEAGRLLAGCPPERPHVLQLTTESLTEAAACLFERYGFRQQFAEDVMRRDLRACLPNLVLPPGIRFTTWTPALAGQFFAVYQFAFRERQRPGYPEWSQDEWVDWIGTDDDDFLPELSLLACHDDLPVGFIVCADEWIVQLGVRPKWRGRGIGSALVTEVLRRSRAGGGDHVLLDVHVNNASAARVYAQLGFERVGRRARYLRVLA